MKQISLVGLFLIFTMPVLAQWQTQFNDPNISFRGLCVVSEKIAWASGSKGSVLRTIDGTTWQQLPVAGAEKLDFRDIHAFNAQEAVVVSAGEATTGAAKIFKTNDGGKTWRLVFETTQKGVFFDGVDFWNKKDGIIFSDPVEGRWFLLQTHDGGNTWEKLIPETLPLCEDNEAAFAASGTSLVIASKGKAFICTGGSTYARIFASTDYGKNWTVSSTAIAANASTGLFGMHFWDAQHGFAVGGDYKQVNKAMSHTLYTQDGGKTWQEASQTNPAGLKEGVALWHKRILVAVGPSGTSKSSDWGQTWQAIDQSAFHAVGSKGNSVWAVGKGIIARLQSE